MLHPEYHSIINLGCLFLRLTCRRQMETRKGAKTLLLYATRPVRSGILDSFVPTWFPVALLQFAGVLRICLVMLELEQETGLHSFRHRAVSALATGLPSDDRTLSKPTERSPKQRKMPSAIHRFCQTPREANNTAESSMSMETNVLDLCSSRDQTKPNLFKGQTPLRAPLKAPLFQWQ